MYFHCCMILSTHLLYETEFTVCFKTILSLKTVFSNNKVWMTIKQKSSDSTTSCSMCQWTSVVDQSGRLQETWLIDSTVTSLFHYNWGWTSLLVSQPALFPIFNSPNDCELSVFEVWMAVSVICIWQVYWISGVISKC